MFLSSLLSLQIYHHYVLDIYPHFLTSLLGANTVSSMFIFKTLHSYHNVQVSLLYAMSRDVCFQLQSLTLPEHVLEVRGQLVGFCSLLPSLGSRDWTQAIILGWKLLYLLSHLASQRLGFYSGIKHFPRHQVGMLLVFCNHLYSFFSCTLLEFEYVLQKLICWKLNTQI